jgi:hypothetical protein
VLLETLQDESRSFLAEPSQSPGHHPDQPTTTQPFVLTGSKVD